jgi:hypothetical protein
VDGVNVTSWLRPVVFVSMLGLSLLMVGPADAQTPSRPYRGLFGGAQPLTTRAPSLSLSLSGFGGWDQPTVEAPTTAAGDRVNASGPFTGTTAGLDFVHPGERLELQGSAHGFAGYFPDNSEDPWYTSSSASGSVNYQVPLSQRSRLRFGENAQFATDVRLGFIGSTPGSSILPATGNAGFDNSLERDPSIYSTSDVGYSYSFSQASSIDAVYGYHMYHFFNADSERSGHQEQQAGVTYHHGIGRYASLILGYTYRHNLVPDTVEPPLTMHDINAGVNYSRALSLTRQTKLSFHTGSTVTSATKVSQPTPETQTHFFVVGGAELLREIGQTWGAQATYNRSVTYDAGFLQPILRDEVTAGIGGLIGRNVDVSSGVYYTVGAIGLESTNYHSWQASSQVRWAITRSLAAYVSYYYYLHNFGSDVSLPTGVVQELHRNGVRVGLTTWLPLWTGRGAP